MKPRLLIADDQIIVILDTSPVRDLAFLAEPPPWVKTFSEMAVNGYSFSLADAAAAELLNQVQTEATSLPAHRQMIRWVSTFLNPDVPVLPGKFDVEGMIGLVQEWDASEARQIATEAWTLLNNPFGHRANYFPPISAVLEEERQEWQNFFARLRQFALQFGVDVSQADVEVFTNSLIEHVAAAHDSKSGVSPPPSVRRHLEFRYKVRQFVRTERAKEPYNPATRGNKNDGIDIDLYYYLMLPALIVATDRGFYGSLEGIDSFQRAWFMPPERLATDWLAGNAPKPEWPAPSVD